MRTIRRVTIVMGACVALGSLALVAPTPAGAVGTVTVAPSTGLVHGQDVVVSGTGFPGTAVGVCQVADIGAEMEFDDCGNGTARVIGPGAGGTFDLTIAVKRSSYVSSLGRVVDCGDPTEDCAIAVAEANDVGLTAVLTPVTFDPAGPDVTVTPDEDLVAGQIVSIAGTGLSPDTDVSARQCITQNLETVPRCTDSSPLATTDGAGSFSATYRVMGAVGQSCLGGAAFCDLRFDEGDTEVASAPLSFDPTPLLDPEITVTPSTGLGKGQGTTVAGTGFYPGMFVNAAICLAGASAPPDCTESQGFAVTDGFGVFSGPVPVTAAFGTTSCSTAPGTCEMRVTQNDLVATAPLAFDPAASDRQPDGIIVRLANGTLIGDNVYNTDAADQQRIRPARAGTRLFFPVRLQNDSVEVDDITVTAPAGPPGFTVRYYFGLYDLTPFITTGGVTFHTMNHTERRTISVDITVAGSVAPGTAADVLVTMTSGDDPTRVDAVRVGVTVPS